MKCSFNPALELFDTLQQPPKPAIDYLDLTFPAPEDNLAADEALLDAIDRSPHRGVLRVYEPASDFVVLGYGNRAATEVDLAACAREGIPVLRRISGGGTVVMGPGCLAYALILPIESHPDLGSVTGTNRHVMNRLRSALEGVMGRPVLVQGHTDLTTAGRKFSGNAQRRRRQALLFHGTFLLHFDLPRLGRLLRMPSAEPDYRQGRSHDDFATNAGVAPDAVKRALREAWEAEGCWTAPLDTDVARLRADRYGLDAWHRRR